MARYQIDDTVVDTDLAQQSWQDLQDVNGTTVTAHTTRDGWESWASSTLYRSRSGRYYGVSENRERIQAAWMGEEQAARWLLVRNYPLPDDLAGYADVILD